VTRIHLSQIQRRALRDGLSVAGVLLLVTLFVVGGDPGYDAYAYWMVHSGEPPYAQAEGLGSFRYGPPVVIALQALPTIGWPAFYWLVAAAGAGALLWLTRSWALAWLAFLPVASELYHGNIDLLLAAAIVAGFRWPAAWALVLLTKITPGVGLIWFAVRREWRQLAVAIGVTAAIAIPTVVLRPDLWAEWLAILPSYVPPRDGIYLPVPVAVRVALAVPLIVWGARTDRRWTVIVGAMIAQPILGIIGLSMLAGVQRLTPAAIWETGRRPGVRHAPQPGAQGA
jgi:hypothetical protein